MTLLLAFYITPAFCKDNPKESSVEKKRTKQKKPNRFINKLMSKLTDEEKAKLKELQKNSPEAFRKELKVLAKKYKLHRSKMSEKVRELVEKFNTAEGEKEKEEIISQLTEAVREEFNKSMENNRKNCEKAEKRLQELKAKIEKKAENAEKIISNRVKQLTRNK